MICGFLYPKVPPIKHNPVLGNLRHLRIQTAYQYPLDLPPQSALRDQRKYEFYQLDSVLQYHIHPKPIVKKPLALGIQCLLRSWYVPIDTERNSFLNQRYQCHLCFQFRSLLPIREIAQDGKYKT